MLLGRCISVQVAVCLLLCVAVGVYGQTRGEIGRAVWKNVAAVDAGESIELRLSLHQRGLSRLQELALAISSPQHEQYGQFLSVHEVDRLVSPPPGDVELVLGWLKARYASFALHGRAIVL